MSDLIYIIGILAALWAVTDVLRTMGAGVPRNLWLFAVIAVPLVGPGYWYYVQHVQVRKRHDSQR